MRAQKQGCISGRLWSDIDRRCKSATQAEKFIYLFFTFMRSQKLQEKCIPFVMKADRIWIRCQSVQQLFVSAHISTVILDTQLWEFIFLQSRGVQYDNRLWKIKMCPRS